MKRTFLQETLSPMKMSECEFHPTIKKTNHLRMKTIIFSLIAVAAFGLNLNAQETIADSNSANPIVETIFTPDTVKTSANEDTTIVRIGKKDVKVINHNGGTEIVWGKDSHKKDKSGKFNGHWEGFEFGFNAFDKPNYGMYSAADNDFMSLNQGKSMELNFNFYELNIGLRKNYIGLVSGMGLSFNNYRFEKPYTLKEGAVMTEPALLAYNDLSKTKLAVSYLTVPLLLEFQIPVNQNEGRVFVNAGLIGGVKLGSHTKVKHGDTKDKDRGGFNMNSFKYAATARVGYKDVSLFATYSLTPLFKTGKGPELTPFTVGISFLD